MSQESNHGNRFVAEAREHLSVMSAAMIALERDEANPQAYVEQVLRAAHSIKGGAGFTGHRNIERLAHAMEEAIENIRDGHVARSPEIVDALLAVLDRIIAMVDDLDRSDEADISEPLARLKPLLASREAEAPPAAQSVGSSASENEFPLSRQVLATWKADGAFLYGLKLDWHECERSAGLSPHDIAARLERAGQVLESHTRPSGPPLSTGLPQPPTWYLAVVSSPLGLEQFTSALDLSCATIAQLRERSPAAEATAAAAAAPTPARARTAQSATSLRISVPLIDRMMALAGELVLVRNQALRSADPATSPLRRLLRRLDSVTNELQDAALRMRTQPVGTLFDRFPRMVRDLARQLGKQIEVEITGSEVELDKTILEMLADPLTHLIRNCCDHGVERPERRTAAGKAPGGRILLSARQDRGQIVIEVRDDGRGIDPEAVKRKALEQRIKRGDELERMSPRQVYDLILLSGFSTAAQVTDVSGRGVGMDVVKTNLDQIGGVIEIDSVIGKGTIFTLRLPLTLAIMPCLLLGSDDQCYAVPQRDVEEIVLLDSARGHRGVERDHDGEVLRWRDRLLPVARLREILRRREPFDARAWTEIAERYHLPEHAAATSYGAVIRLGSRRFVLVFDRVLQSENIVVKPLPPILRPLGIYAATTILGDGSVSLILNSEGIARHGGILGRPVVDSPAVLPPPVESAREHHVILFRFGPSELLAISMASVRRVVMVSHERIERIGDRELVNVDGTATNILRLDNYLSVSGSGDDRKHLFLLLPRNGASPVGLLASEIVDTPMLKLDLDPLAYQADGVLGSAIIRGEITIFLDFDRLVQMWDATHRIGLASLPDQSAKRVLVIDDTAFFRKFVGEYLRSEGFEVAVAEDGSAGLAKLRDEHFDAVVSDVEMPVMDGLTFAKRVRADAQLALTPMMALTTLNTPESRAAAMSAGFDAYEVKLDRQGFLAAIRSLLKRSASPKALHGGVARE